MIPMNQKYKKIIVILFAIFFIIPIVIFTVRFFKSESQDVLLEISSDKIITKYTFDEQIDNEKNIVSLLTNNQKELVSQEEHQYDSLDNYFDQISSEYQDAVIDDRVSEPPLSSTIKPQDNQNVLSQNNDNNVVLNENTTEAVDTFNNLTTLNLFSGENITEKNKSSFEMQDKLANRLEKEFDKESNFGNLETYLNQKFSKKYERSYKRLSIENSKTFFTSPPPNNKNDTNLAELKQLDFILDKDKYYRFEIVRGNLVTKSRINIKDLQAKVYRGKYIIPNVGGKSDFFFRYKDNTIYINFALGYNPPPGTYVIKITSKKNPDWAGIEKPFVLLKRAVPPLQKGFSVVNWEYNGSLNFQITAPDRTRGGAENLIKWLKYMDVDAFWLLAAQTSGWYKKTSPENPWVISGPRNLKVLSKLAKEQDLLVGAYFMSYYTPANGKKPAGYNPSLGYDSRTKKLQDSLHISLLDQKRLDHIIATAKDFQADPYVDFIGLDFIRTGRADGYEMGPRVVEDMNIATPVEYDDYTTIQKIKWFASKVENLSNRREVTKWRWWRAHRVATIANTVIREAKLTKPVWVFTLGWKHGQQHGQDPYMFFDAGVFIDAIMLYEANRIQFRNMMIQWPNYMRDYRNNLVIGNASDIRFLDNQINNYSAEYIYRSKKAFRNIYRGSYAKGLFIHDLSRMLWSSKRGYNIDEWASLHGYATTAFRAESGLFPYRAKIRFNADLYSGVITIENTTDKPVYDLKVKPSYTTVWKYIRDNLPEAIDLKPREKKQFSFTAKIRDKFAKQEKVLSYAIESPNYRKYFFLTYYTKRNNANELLTHIK